jgi:hypothetical protein
MKRRSFLKQTALSATALALPGSKVFGARKKETDYESKVPKFTSANTLAEQERQLKNNPLPRFEFFVNNTTSLVNASAPVNDDEWHFVAGTFGSQTLPHGIPLKAVTGESSLTRTPAMLPESIRIGSPEQIAAHTRNTRKQNSECFFGLRNRQCLLVWFI